MGRGDSPPNAQQLDATAGRQADTDDRLAEAACDPLENQTVVLAEHR
jgi:hypothetical protein